MSVGGQYAAYPRKYSRLNATADGDNLIVAAVGADERIVVLGYAISGPTTAGVTTFQDTTATPNIMATFDFALNGGAVYAGNNDCPAFELPAGTGLEVSNAAAHDTTGHVTYIVVK